jgi:hypothetical protein
MIKEELIVGLLPSLRKITVFALLNLDYSDEILDELANKDFGSDREEFAAYFKMLPFESSVDDFLSVKIFDITKIQVSTVEAWLAKLSFTKTEGKPPISDWILISDLAVDFNFPDLQKNFLDLTTTCMEKKCSECKKHSEIGSRTICLLCNTVLCSSKCSKGQDSSEGNLNKHARLIHKGISAFLNTENGRIWLINNPKNIDYCALYLDKFGFSVEEKKRDWKEYVLDETGLAKLKEKFILDRIPQEIAYNILNESKKLYDGAL